MDANTRDRLFVGMGANTPDQLYTNWLMSGYSSWGIVAQVTETIDWYTRNGLSEHEMNRGLRDYSEDSDAVY